MTKQQIIEQAMHVLGRLSEAKALELLDFAEFLERREQTLLRVTQVQPARETVELNSTSDNDDLQHGLTHLVADSAAFQFLEDEPDIYSDNDLIERY